MSTYLHAALILLGTVAAFVLPAALLQAARTGRLTLPTLAGRHGRKMRAAPRIGVEEIYPVDSRRRLLLIRCGDQRILLLTGGTTDLVVSSITGIAATGAAT